MVNEQVLIASIVPEGFSAEESAKLNEKLEDLMKYLRPREREVIELRFGLKNGQPQSLKEIARAYGLAIARIRSLEASALKKLRQYTPRFIES